MSDPFTNLKKLMQDDPAELDALKRKNKSKYITSILYANVVLDLDGDDSDKEKVSELYIKEICKLPTDQLELILQTHEDGLFQRADNTIDRIVSELADREIMRKQ